MTRTPRPWLEDRMTRKEAAAYLGLTLGTLEIWASTGRYNLPFVKVGRRVFYRKSDLDAFIEQRTVTNTGGINAT